MLGRARRRSSMRDVRESSLLEYVGWYLHREAHKPSAGPPEADADAQVATMRRDHAGKMRTWFDASTRWRIVELGQTDLANIVFLECSWTRDELLVVPDGPNYRLLRRVAANAMAQDYLSRPTAHRHKVYYD